MTEGMDIAARRLRAQRLVGEPLPSAVDAVRLLVAVQSQDYAGATWALGQRTNDASQAEINRLFDDAKILRTHILRPTWHFVLPEDIHLLLFLTGQRVRRGLAARHRWLSIDEDDLARANEALRGALAGGRFLTRPELGEVLLAAGISPEGQRLAHFLLVAELDGVVISGPRRGKQFTYALLEERAPPLPTPDRKEALAKLACRYFRSHGPAQLQDFVWWSGLTMSDARAGVALTVPQLEHFVEGGKEYWCDPGAIPEMEEAPAAHLLSNWDEYTVAYRDREALLPPNGSFEAMAALRLGVLSHVVVVDGRVRGSWRRTFERARVRVEIQLLGPVSRTERAAIEQASERFGRFLESPVELVWP